MPLYRCTITIKPKGTQGITDCKPEFLVHSDSPISAAVVAETLVTDSTTSRVFLVRGVIVNVEDGADFYILNGDAD